MKGDGLGWTTFTVSNLTGQHLVAVVLTVARVGGSASGPSLGGTIAKDKAGCRAQKLAFLCQGQA